MNHKKSPRYLKSLIVISLILLIVGLYWYGAVEQLAHVNTDMHAIDQSAYMSYARSLYESDYTFIGKRNRMPIYPLLQSLFYRPGLTDEAFFAQGKYVNLVLSIVLLAGLAVIFRRFLSWFASVNLLLLIAFTVFIFKAGYFQTELLFYFLNFCLFLLMWRLLQRMSWPHAISAGIVAGLAHLTKASILPGLMLFLVLGAVKWGWVTLRSWHFSSDPIPTRLLRSPILGVVLAGLFFLITVFPFINTSKRVFGYYFYNVNSTFYVWYDSWDEAIQGTFAHGDGVGWPNLPPEQIPSMSKYMREHTLQQMVDRLANGGVKVFRMVVGSYGYLKHVVFFLCLFVIAVLMSRQRAWRLMNSRPIVCVFLVSYFAGYILLYSWYAPIAPGNRLVLALFIPLMFSISYGLQALLRSSRLKAGGQSVPTLLINNLTILIFVVADIWFVLTERVGTVFGGM